MLKGDVFEYQQFENQIFAIFIHLFMNKASGVAKSYKNAMNVTYSGHTVTIDNGACLVQGRFLEEDSSTTIDAGIETAFCKLVVEIDLDKTNTISDFNQGMYRIVKSELDYPTLTQEDTAGMNVGKYQYELARFKVSEGVVTEFQDMRTYIEDQLKYGRIEEVYNTLNNSKAPISHGSKTNTYGLGADSYYGHCKLVNNCNASAYEQGAALSAYQGKVLKDSIGEKSPTSHASSSTTYGVGTTTNYGHCKLANNLTNSSFANGVALAAYQGYLLNQNKLDKTGGTIKGSVVPGTNNAFDLGSISNLFRNIYAKEFSGTNFYGTNLEMSFGEFLKDLIVREDLTVGESGGSGNIYMNNGAMQSEHTYNNDNVTNAANMYVTSNGWFRRTTGSSERYKTDITEDIEERLNPEVLYNLPIKQFKYKDNCISKEDVRYGKNILGFIAEDVARIYEPAAQYDENGQVEMWNVQVMIPAMLKLIQKQNERIEKLEKLAGVENE